MATTVASAERAESFEDFFHAEYERLLRALYLATGDRHEAEDLAQEAFVRVYERWGTVSGLHNPPGYVYRTALNLRRSRLRRVATAARRLVRIRHEDEPDPARAADDRDAIRRALAAIPAGQREALVLVEWLGLSDVEAAEVLGVASVTVRVRISRARPVLQAHLRGERDA
ncbi:MAG: RNA polymerase sigma factor [Actinomycetota bacterium]